MEILAYLLEIYVFILFVFSLLGKRNLAGFGIVTNVSTVWVSFGFMLVFCPDKIHPIPTTRQRIIGAVFPFGLATILLAVAAT